MGTELAMPDIVKLKLPDGSYEDHLLLRTKEYKGYHMINQDKYTSDQEKKSIDALTNDIKRLKDEVDGLERQLSIKKQEHMLTASILTDKLKARLAELNVKTVVTEPADPKIVKGLTRIAADEAINEMMAEANDTDA
jgi:hypothetical protein